MSDAVASVLLWLFVINLGVAVGAGLYEHRIVVSTWVTTSADDDAHWNVDAARRDDTGRRFWAFVTTVPLTLLTLANLFAAWRSSGVARGWWMAAAIVAVADRAFTFSYFIPTMIRLLGSPDSPIAAATAIRWWRLDYVRQALMATAWLSSLKAFALFSQQHG